MKKIFRLNKEQEININKIKKKNYKFVIIAIMLASLILTGTSFAKYKRTINLATVDLTVQPEMATYTITGDEKILLKQPLTSTSEVTATSSNTGANSITGSFKITPDGAYINDTSSTANYWLYYYFVESDGYTSAFNTSHVYYARCENKITYIEEIANTYFNFGFMNLRHNINGRVTNYGIPVIRTINKEASEDYKVISAWGFPKTHTDRTVGQTVYPGDYMDCIQIGSTGGTILSCYIKNFMVLDLTAIFGEGNEPSQAWCDKYIKYDSSTVTWFALKEQARLNGTEVAYPANNAAYTTLSLEQEDLEYTTNNNFEEETVVEDQVLENSATNNLESLNTNEIINEGLNETTNNITDNAEVENAIENVTENTTKNVTKSETQNTTENTEEETSAQNETEIEGD